MTDWNFPAPKAYLEKKEIWAIISAIPGVSKHIERDQLLLQTMWESGGRVSEVVQLQKHQIVPAELRLILLNLKQKEKIRKATSRKPAKYVRRVAYKHPFVSKKLIDSLLSFCQEHQITNYVFLSNTKKEAHLTAWYVWWIVTKAATASGIRKTNLTKGRTVPAWPHLFRHACAMHILDRTGSTEKAQYQLGHASIVTTQAYASLKLRKSDREISDIDWR